LIVGLLGLFDAVAGSGGPATSRIWQRPAFLRSLLIVLAAALLIVGLAVGDTEEILFKGSIL